MSTDHRKDLACLNTGTPVRPNTNVAASSSQPHLIDPTPQYSRHNRPSRLPSSVFGSSFLDTDVDIGAMSPGYQPPGHPLNQNRDMDHRTPISNQYNLDPMDEAVRRPSVASSATASSTNSKGDSQHGGQRTFKKKKLAGFFGDEYADEHGGASGRQGSESSATLNRQDTEDSVSMRSRFPNTQDSMSMFSKKPGADDASFVSRQGSISNYRPTSPNASKPKGPQPSSEVTPWEFQEADVSLSGALPLNPLGRNFLAAFLNCVTTHTRADHPL